MNGKFKYIYGPVPSWRLGSSLGIDLLSREEKICNFDCVYCQLGPASTHAAEREVYVPVENVVEELKSVPGGGIDYITFSGRGEPTLAANLGTAIKAVKSIRKEPIAVLTNGSLMWRYEVREELALADLVVAKLDACSQDALKRINRPSEGVELADIVEGMKKFKKEYRTRLALQIMFVEENKNEVERYFHLSDYIKPDEVQINTPLRPCGVQPLAREEILSIKDRFIAACAMANVVSVCDGREHRDIIPFSDESTLRRRGKIK